MSDTPPASIAFLRAGQSITSSRATQRKNVMGANEETAMMAWLSRLITIAFLGFVPLAATAQQPATAPTQPLLKPAELDQLLAPIALYPDPLLSEVLIASTYPLEVVQADRWAKSNKALKGEALSAALAKQSWDDSVKSLAQVPDALTMMMLATHWSVSRRDASRYLVLLQLN